MVSISKKVLVTGGAGFIGSHIVDELVAKGHEVRVFDNLEPQVHKGIPAHLNPNVEFMSGDVRDKEAICEALKDIEVVFHDAAAVGVGQSMYQIEKYMDINTMGTARLLDLLVNKEHDVKKLVVASSMSIYGEGEYECENCGLMHPTIRPEEQFKALDWEVKCPSCGKPLKPIPTRETKPLHCTSIYAISKKDQEEMSLVTGRAYGIPTVALRYFNVYGPRQSLNNPYTGVAAIFSSRIKNGNAPLVYEDGIQSRDFTNVKDIAQANMVVMNSSNANYEAFNVGTGMQATINDIAITLAKLYGTDIKPEIVNGYRAGDIRHCYADISKLKAIGYEPSVPFESGMGVLVDWGKTVTAEDKSAEAHKELLEKGLVSQ